MSTNATLTSADGTTIAYETSGSGPAVILISTVAEDRTGVAGLAELLAEHFTVISYDRRGRGASGDPQPYDPAREIEDIGALIETLGGAAALLSGSAGCALALDAADALGEAVTALYLYEPPFIVSDARPPMPPDYVEHQEQLVAEGRRGDAVEYFMTQALGIPAEWVEGMKQDPSWEQMSALAHTYAYDGRIMRGLQDGTALPRDRWSTRAPVHVVVGENSEPFVLEGANALAEILPRVTIEVLPGQDHSAFWLAPGDVADSARAFLTS
ncbi:alpha/beta fold hydrolase [Aeromicrobium sp. CTD01-1L150]|uniref:alpha/beta fold hydrolase n=1 Tax=Aeromicrobium sp. CTD01-1L150 TaxID=3341830 RepID=UPI0035C00EC5